MVLITIVNGVYKPTNITGGPHIVCEFSQNSARMIPGFHCQNGLELLLWPPRGRINASRGGKIHRSSVLNLSPWNHSRINAAIGLGRMLRVADAPQGTSLGEENSNETGAL